MDGAALVQRADDTEEVFAERMRAYEALTAPVVEHYRALGRFAEVDGDACRSHGCDGVRFCASGDAVLRRIRHVSGDYYSRRPQEIEKMRRAGKMVREVLEQVRAT